MIISLFLDLYHTFPIRYKLLEGRVLNHTVFLVTSALSKLSGIEYMFK